MAKGELDVGQQMEEESEASLLDRAANKIGGWLVDNGANISSGVSGGDDLRTNAITGYYDYRGEVGRDAHGRGQEQENLRGVRSDYDDALLAHWNAAQGPQKQDVVVGYTKGGMRPDRTESGTRVERKVLSPEGQAAIDAEAEHGAAAAEGARKAKEREQYGIYSVAQDVETARRHYADQERSAAEKFAQDMGNAQFRVSLARQRLAEMGNAPDMTIKAVFDRADGAKKVMGLAGMLLGGVGAAAFSAINHQPNKSAFFEEFERQAQKTVDRFMTDRDTAGKVLSAEQQGMDGIRQAFGDDRSAREFVMAAVMKTYAAKLEQVAAQYGIDRTSADFQAILSQIYGKYADRQMGLAANVTESEQASQKYVPPQAITRKVPVNPAARAAASIDPDLQRDLLIHRENKRKQEEAEISVDEMTPEMIANRNRLEEEELRLEARQKKVFYEAAAQRVLAPVDADTEERVGKLLEEREKRGTAEKEKLRVALDRIARKMRDKPPGLRQDLANWLASGGQSRAESVTGQLIADDPEMAQDLAIAKNEIILSLTGKAVAGHETGRMLTGLGSGNLDSVANLASSLERSVDADERALASQFGMDASEQAHLRMRVLKKLQAKMPWKDNPEAPE